MKTILYQPIFINPQAYFVFPSLYHIEKGDSFIEPANITGQLIINTLTDDPTLTPIILTVKDNNQVDFSIFAGKHIRISQYTDEGAVVLGEWLMPGESTPVYSDWFTSSVKAIYDPAKQGMTNYDVIEAYVEDFTNWNYVKARGVATISQHKFIITECILKGLSIVEDIQEPYSNLTVRIIGITDNQEVLITDYVNGQHQIINTITEDGIYTIEDRHHFVGFGCNFVGTCNITIEQLPTSILKDLSGNGNHAYLYGGKGKLNSGMGVYKFDFLSDLRINSAYLPYTERQDDKICSLAGHPAGWLFQFTSLSDIPAFKVEVKGIVNDNFTYRWYDENGNRGVDIAINEDGIYELPMSYSVETNAGVGIVCNDLCQDNVCFTQLPDYPNQLCYNGEMYAVCYGFPILTDYTVMAERTWFDKTGVKYFLSKYKENGSVPGQLFKFEWIVNGKEYSTSLGRDVEVVFPNGITWQTKTSYNGKGLLNSTYEDGDLLLIGKVWLNSTNYFIGCHGKIIIADRSFTEDEITWLKENIYNIEI